MARLTFSDSIVIACPAERLYDLVADISRTGEWNPVCTSCWWDEGAGPSVGAWFTGHNETPVRIWETRSQVVAATPGREFAWAVNHGWARWGYTFEPVAGGTSVTESWELTPDGVAGFHQRWPDDAEAQIDERSRAAHTGIPATLAALKRIAEAAEPAS